MVDLPINTDYGISFAEDRPMKLARFIEDLLDKDLLYMDHKIGFC